ncbi:MAG: hypothetical protein H0V07_11680 [Propionibacteriales bacterium]|nr:hypothetical protein [Propionibacteriales bacterium]
MRRGLRASWLLKAAGIGAVFGLIAVPSLGASPVEKAPPNSPQQFAEGSSASSSNVLGKLSAGPLTRRLVAHPEQAPAASQDGYRTLRDLSAKPATPTDSGLQAGVSGSLRGQRLNDDRLGLPQNEESIARCTSRPNVVLGGTNDYRGLLDPQGNFTGWHFSTDGGRTLKNEGLLPAINFGGGNMIPSGGDPINVAGRNCALFAGSLNYDPADFFPNGVGLYKTTPRRLSICPGGNSSYCWPHRKVVVKADDPHKFLDKPWIYVSKGFVWVVYTEFICPDIGCAGNYSSNSIKAVRCRTDLRNCTAPILISGNQRSIQFGDVTIGPDGRTYITWEQDNDFATNFGPPEHMKFWLRVAPPGSLNFGPARLVARERKNLGIATLHANDFRVGTYPKNTVKTVNGRPRVYVVWDGCRARPLGGSVCEEPAIKMRYSNDKGRTWTRTKVLSARGDNYFPTISANQGGRQLAVAWYTNRFDPVFHNRQDVELATVSRNGTVRNRQRLTTTSNETEADPLLGGTFIGDYIEVVALDDKALVHYNANYRSTKLLGSGFAVPQQDNFLARRGL